MTKLFKRISAVAMAAAMATTMAVSASAELHTSSTEEQDFCGGKAEGVIYAEDTMCTVTVGTYYTNVADRIFVGFDIDDSITGELLKSCPRTEEYNEYYIERSRTLSENPVHPVTIFSSHEIFDGKEVWGDYTQLYSVKMSGLIYV